MGRGARGGGGGGNKTSVGQWMSRSRFFRALKLGGPSYHENKMLQQVAVARGLRNVDELLVSIGKQETGLSMEETQDLMRKEFGSDAVTRYLEVEHFSGRKKSRHCEDLLKSYLEDVEEYGEGHVVPNSLLKPLRKYCDYHVNEENKEEKL